MILIYNFNFVRPITKEKITLLLFKCHMYLARCTNRGNYPDLIGIWKCWLAIVGENRRTRRKPTTKSTRETLLNGERLHHCATPVLHYRGSENAGIHMNDVTDGRGGGQQ